MKKNKGLTLVEIIVSLAIIGIIAVTLLTVFNTSMKNIVKAGKKSKAVAIAEENLYTDPVTIRTDTIVVELPSFDGLKRIEVNGCYIKGKADAIDGTANTEAEIEAFVPGMLENDTE